MNVSGSGPAAQINLDEFERRLRAAGTQQVNWEDPLVELAKLVDTSPQPAPSSPRTRPASSAASTSQPGPARRVPADPVPGAVPEAHPEISRRVAEPAIRGFSYAGRPCRGSGGLAIADLDACGRRACRRRRGDDRRRHGAQGRGARSSQTGPVHCRRAGPDQSAASERRQCRLLERQRSESAEGQRQARRGEGCHDRGAAGRSDARPRRPPQRARQISGPRRADPALPSNRRWILRWS